jgi:hypothetical protein
LRGTKKKANQSQFADLWSEVQNPNIENLNKVEKTKPIFRRVKWCKSSHDNALREYGQFLGCEKQSQ